MEDTLENDRWEKDGKGQKDVFERDKEETINKQKTEKHVIQGLSE